MLLNCGIDKTLESPLDCKEIKPINPKGNKSWIFIGRTDAEAEDPILLPPNVKSWLIGKDPDAGKDWKQEEKGTAEDEMVGWHHRLDGHEFEHAPGVGNGQGSLECCSPWGCKESDMAEQLNWTVGFKTGILNFLLDRGFRSWEGQDWVFLFGNPSRPWREGWRYSFGGTGWLRHLPGGNQSTLSLWKVLADTSLGILYGELRMHSW